MCPRKEPTVLAKPARLPFRNESQHSVFLLSLPVFIELSLQMAIQFVDAILLSRISDSAAGVVGVLSSFFSLLMMIFVSLSQAGNIKVTYALGAGKHRRAEHLRWTVLAMNVVLSMVCASLVSTFGTHWLGRLYSFSSNQLLITSEYLGVAAWALVPQSITLALTGFVRSEGRPFWTLPGSIVGNLVNAGLGYILVSKGHGVQAVAWSAIAGHLTMNAWNLFAAFSLMQIKISIPRKLFMACASSILKLFTPIALEPFAYQASQVLIGTIVARLGIESLAARTYSQSLIVFCLLWTIAMSHSVQYIVSIELARGNKRAAEQSLKKSLRSSMMASCAFSLMLALMSSKILPFMSTNPIILQQAEMLLWIAAVAECGRTSNIVVGSALKAAGDAHYPACVGLVFMVGVSVPLSAFLSLNLGLGLAGIGAAQGVDELMRGALNLRRWRSKYANS